DFHVTGVQTCALPIWSPVVQDGRNLHNDGEAEVAPGNDSRICPRGTAELRFDRRLVTHCCRSAPVTNSQTVSQSDSSSRGSSSSAASDCESVTVGVVGGSSTT